MEKINLTENLSESERAIPYLSYSLKNSLFESDMKTKQLEREKELIEFKPYLDNFEDTNFLSLKISEKS